MRHISTYSLECQFDFGKYKGMTVNEVSQCNNNYITWAILNVRWFCLEQEDLLYLKEHERRNLGHTYCTDKVIAENESKLKEYEKSNNHKRHDYYDDYTHDLRKNWLVYAAGTSDPEIMSDVFWNID